MYINVDGHTACSHPIMILLTDVILMFCLSIMSGNKNVDGNVNTCKTDYECQRR